MRVRSNQLVLDLIKAQAAAGATIITVLHDLNLAAMIATRMVVMKRGRIFRSGEPRRVITNEVIEEAFGVSHAVASAPPGDTPFVLPQGMKISNRVN